MGLTKPRAAQIFNLDYKQSTRVVTTTNITLSGGAPSLVDGVTLSLGDRILVTGQSTGNQNGLYYVTTLGSGANGTWARTSDGNENGEIEAGMIVMVTEGTIYADTQWKLITNDPIVIGTTALTFTQNYMANSISSGTSNVVVNSNANVTISSAGTANVLTISSTGTVTSGTASVSGNVTGGNIITAGNISAVGTIYSNGAVNSTAFAVGNSAVSNIALGMFPTAGTSGEYAIRDYSTVFSHIYFDVGIGGTANGAFQFRSSNAFRQFANINSSGITTPLAVSAIGNVTGNYFIGNGSQLTGIVAAAGASITNGTSNVVVSASGNVTVGVAGTATVATFTTAGLVANSVAATNNGNATNFKVGDDAWLGDINTADTIGIRGQQNAANAYIVFGNADNTQLGRAGSGPLTYGGAFSATGNITGGNILTGGLISATGNITGGNIRTAGLISATSTITSAANVVGGNITTAGLITATGNITGGNVLTGGLISATGAITGAAITGTSLTVSTGNITAGNLLLTGAIVDSAQLDIQTSAGNANIALAPNGTGVVTVSTQVSAVGNVTGGNIRTAGLISATGTVTGSQFNGSGAGLTSIPNSALANSSITVNGTAISLGGSGTVTANAATLTGTALNATVVSSSLTSVGTLSSLSVTGNIGAGNLNITGGIVDTGALDLITGANGNINLSPNGTGVIVANKDIRNGQANGVGNIGASGATFNTIFAKATSAQYADLAENYLSDSNYPPGTVVEFGGTAEITQSTCSHSTRVAGIVSTNPSYLMNAAQTGDHVLPVALTGRVPCRVVGHIAKGDRLVAGDRPGVATLLDMAQYQPACIIGKALEEYDSNQIGTIEVAVGRF